VARVALAVVVLSTYVGLAGLCCGAEWLDRFEHRASVGEPWDKAEGIAVDATGGFKESAAVTGVAVGRPYGTLWRKAPAGPALEVTGKIRVASGEGWTGALLGLSPTIEPDPGDPLTPAYAPSAALRGDYLAVRVVKPRGDEKGQAQLLLTYANPACGQTLPYRLGKLETGVWYDVRMQVWPSDGVYLATAWYRRAGAQAWTTAADNWPGKRHVVAYEAFAPTYVMAVASAGAWLDDVKVRTIRPPGQKALPPARTINPQPFTLVSLSWSSPDTRFFAVNLATMGKTPFDGWATYAAWPRLEQGRALYGWGTGDLGWEVFQNKRATPEQVQPAIADLKPVRASRFRSNYIANVSYLNNATMDWFDDGWWATIAENGRIQAFLAKEGGCEGILLDPEMYGCSFWGWPALSKDPLYRGKTYAQVQAQVRQRGREFARAINSEYPGIRILSLHGWDTALRYEDPPATQANLPERNYGLLPAFLDGMLEGSDDETVIVDGCEATYWVDAFPDFAERAESLRKEGRRLSTVPALFRQKVRVGFAIYLDRDWRGSPWNSVKPDANHWSPERLALVVGNALAAGDGLVWIYSESATWHLDSADRTIAPYVKDVGWHGAAMSFVADGYRQALDAGRRRACELRDKYGK
jgi:hypothetical protein